MKKEQAIHRAYYAAIPLGFILLDLLLRGKVLLHFAWPEWRTYLVSILLSLSIFRGTEWMLHSLRHRGFRKVYGIALGLTASLYGTNLLFSYSYYAANSALPDLFTLSYIRWETAHAWVMARDTFQWHHALVLTTSIIFVAWLFHRATALVPRPWNLPWYGKSLHGILMLGLLIFCIANAAERAQCFLPDVNTPSICGRYLWKEFRGQNPPPIRLRPRKPLPIPETFPRPPVNILVILNESLRRQSLQICGYNRETTPQMKRFAQGHPGEFFLFRKAFTNSSGTLLSVPSIFTGISPLQPVERRSEAPLLWEWARAAGMRTFLVSSQDLSWCSMDRFLTTPSPDLFWDKRSSGHEYFRDWGIDDRFTVDRAVQHLESLARNEEPFVGVIHLNTNHYPYNTAPKYQRWKKNNLDLYDNTVLEMDTHTGRILRTLETLGMLDNTVVIFASDHGEAFEEHGYVAHFYCHYIETISVPIWMYLPPAALKDRDQAPLHANLRVNIQNLDLMPTMLDLLGIHDQPKVQPLLQQMQGTSLLRRLPKDRNLFATNTDEVLPYDVGLSLVRNHMHYLLRTSTNPPQEELYDLDADPWEKRNLWKRVPEKDRQYYRTTFAEFPFAAKVVQKALAPTKPINMATK